MFKFILVIIFTCIIFNFVPNLSNAQGTNRCQPLGDMSTYPNCKGSVNSLDLSYLLSKIGSTDFKANLDNTGSVNSLDLSILIVNLGKSFTPPPPTPPPPTPGSTLFPQNPSPPPTGNGNTIYVSTSGNDSNNGSSNTPFRTVTKALSLAGTGDTIYFNAGTYPAFTINSKSSSETNPLTISAASNQRVIINANGAGEAIRLSNTTGVVIRNLEVTGATTTYHGGIYIDGGSRNRIVNVKAYNNRFAGIVIFKSSNNIIQESETYNNVSYGIWVDGTQSTTANNIIQNNHSHHNLEAVGGADGIAVSGAYATNTTIRNNIVHDNNDDGIDTWSSSGGLVEGNISYNQTYSGDGNGIKAGGSTTGGNYVVRYNISYNNKVDGITSNGTGGNRYYNNVSYNNGGDGFDDSWRNSGATGCSPRTDRCTTVYANNIAMNNRGYNANISFARASNYNIWYNSSGSPKIRYNGNEFTSVSAVASQLGFDRNSKVANPLFQNPGAALFSLQSGSPAINAGDPLNPGGGITIGPAPDIGRYEFLN